MCLFFRGDAADDGVYRVNQGVWNPLRRLPGEVSLYFRHDVTTVHSPELYLQRHG